MSFYIFQDGNDLLSSQLNGNFGNTLDITTATPQTVVSSMTIGGLTTTALTASGTSIFGGSEGHFDRVVTAAGTYVVQASDYVISINKTVSAPNTVTLPSAPSHNRWLIILDLKGDCAANPITISGAQLINGQSSLVLSNNYASVQMKYSITTSSWNIL